MKPGNIFETIFPFYCILKCFGFLPFSFVGPVEKGNFAMTLWGFLYSALIVSLHFSFIAFCYLQSFSMFQISIVLERGAQLELLSNVFVTVINIALQTYKQKKIQLFLELLHKFDLEVDSVKFKQIYITLTYIFLFADDNPQ